MLKKSLPRSSPQGNNVQRGWYIQSFKICNKTYTIYSISKVICKWKMKTGEYISGPALLARPRRSTRAKFWVSGPCWHRHLPHLERQNKPGEYAQWLRSKMATAFRPAKANIYLVPKGTSRVCMYVCMYVWMYVCMHACIYACMHACLSVRTYVCMYVCVYVCMCIYTYMYMCMFMFMLVYACYTLNNYGTVKKILSVNINALCFSLFLVFRLEDARGTVEGGDLERHVTQLGTCQTPECGHSGLGMEDISTSFKIFQHLKPTLRQSK